MPLRSRLCVLLFPILLGTHGFSAFAQEEAVRAAPPPPGASVTPDIPEPPPDEPADALTIEELGGSGSFLSGRYAREKGDRSSALQYLEESQAANPDDAKLASQLMVMHLGGGEVAKAVAQAQKLASAEPHEKIADLLLAVEAVKTGSLAEAGRNLNRAYADGGAVWLPLLTAWLDAGERKLKKPLQPAAILPKGTQRPPPFLAYHVALINDYAGFPAVAAQQYELAVLDHSRAPFRAVEAAADFYRRKGDLEKLAQLRLDYLNSHPTMSALGESDAALQMAALMAQENAGGQGALVGSVQEGVAEVLFTMASLIYSVDAAQDAELYLRMALYLRPDFPVAQLLLGNLLESDEHYPEAAAVYDAVSPQSPLFARALLRKAYVVERQGKLEEALAMLDARAAQHPDEYDTFVARGDLLRSRARFAEAARSYSQAIERIAEPGAQHWGIFFARGACYERSGQWEKAEGDLRRSLTLNPQQPEVLNYLGYSLLARDRSLPEARALIEEAFALQPDSPHILDSMGWALYKTGELEGAVKFLEQAIEQMPGDATVNDHLGDAYWQAGRKTEARYQWQRALTYKPEPLTQNAIERKLKDGLPALASSAPASPASPVEETQPPPPPMDEPVDVPPPPTVAE